jgi:arylsulfatase
MAETVKNNLLIITFDQLRGDWFDPISPVVPTPNISKLASGGWTFRRSYTSSPNCVPARMSWITGMYGSQLGVTKALEVDLPPDAPSLIRQMQLSGWHTEMIGKTHLTTHEIKRDLRTEIPRLKALGFDFVLEITGPRASVRIESELTEEWAKAGLLEKQRADMNFRYNADDPSQAWKVRPTILPDHLYPDIWVANQAVKRIEALPLDKPWILWASFPGPHEPFDTPKPWAGCTEEKVMPPPVPPAGWISELPQNAQVRKVFDKWNGKVGPADVQDFRRDYADHVLLLDEQIGLLIDALKKREDHQHTAIIFTSDHGDLLGDMGVMYKNCFLEGAVRVPWVFCPPPAANVQRGSSTQSPACGLGLLKKAINSVKENKYAAIQTWMDDMTDVVSEFDAEIMLVQGFKKIVLNHYGAVQWAVDLEHDPHEQINLVQNDPKLLRRSKEWKTIYKKASKFFRQRQKRKWVWRNLEDTI